MYKCRSCVCIYLAGHVGHFGEEGVFRALERGYAHWASGRLSECQSNFLSSQMYHITIDEGWHIQVYMLLGKEGDVVIICSAKCDCAAG